MVAAQSIQPVNPRIQRQQWKQISPNPIKSF
jgi:hypothetical protein